MAITPERGSTRSCFKLPAVSSSFQQLPSSSIHLPEWHGPPGSQCCSPACRRHQVGGSGEQ
eukprot:15436155-Alexandrium_andersonii.AAC.1